MQQNHRFTVTGLLPAERHGTTVKLELLGIFGVSHMWSEARERCNV
jgi:hypothetical protein